jgi:hypothetical protein
MMLKRREKKKKKKTPFLNPDTASEQVGSNNLTKI